MKRLILFLSIILLFLLLSGCVNETVYIDTTPPVNRTLAVVATQNSLFAQQSTMTASVRQTEVMQNILLATVAAEQLRATQVAQALGLTVVAERSIQTATAASQQTEDALNATRTSVALVQLSNDIANERSRQELIISRQRMLNSILGWTMFLVILAFFSLLGWGFWQFLRASMVRRMPPEPQLTPFIISDRRGRLVTVNPARGGTPPQVIESSFSQPRLQAASPTPTVANVQEANAANVQETRRYRQQPEIPAVASWRRVSEDWQGGTLPLGMSSDGMIAVKPEINPHLLIAGAAGSGKTRFALRPLAAAALADGWQVIIIARNDGNFTLFQQHPNASLLTFGTNPAEEAARYLSRFYEEIRRRVTRLESAGVEMWLDLGEDAARTLIVIDDFQDVITGITSLEKRNELWQQARSVTAEGQRAGIHLMLAVQDPSYTDLDLRIRRYMSPVSFRVGEALISRVVLNTDGAEELCPRQFMAILDKDLVFGFAFAPDDTEIIRFLDDHPHPQLPAPDWLFEPDDQNEEQQTG